MEDRESQFEYSNQEIIVTTLVHTQFTLPFLDNIYEVEC